MYTLIFHSCQGFGWIAKNNAPMMLSSLHMKKFRKLKRWLKE